MPSGDSSSVPLDLPADAATIDGVALDGVLGKLATLPLLLVAAGIADALAGLHEGGVVHVDVRPSNILVSLASGRARFVSARPSTAVMDARSAKAWVSSSLVYMAPERTGRLSTVIDGRADLYSLGVSLYQLATGKLPFAVSEPLQWVHAHLAIRPIPPVARAEMPDMLQRVLLKLLEKEPEDRYQTATGLASDLRECHARFEASGAIAPFPLGRRDAPGRLLRRPALQGREHEVDALAAAAGRVQRTGSPELVLVSGYSGIGKSSLVREVLGQRLPQDALVAAAKFDDLESVAPYATLMLAFRQLCRWVLAKPAAVLDDWKAAIANALGGNASVVAEFVPELALILGPALPVPWLPADEAKNRISASFRQFLRAFAARKRPLVLFLDDLQWLDRASMELIENLLLDPELYGVLLIGAYRVESVSAEHPLQASVARLIAGGRAVHTLTLAPLASPDIGQLVADLLLSAPEPTAELGRVVEEKTGGNPFFVRQFLTALVEEHILWFDQERGLWAWEPSRIAAKGSTDNLTDLLLERLARLPLATQGALEMLACLGVRSSPALLAELSDVSLETQSERLRAAVDAGVVVETGEGYAFSHDRLLTAAYSRIPENERPARHLRIGRVLRDTGDGIEGEGLFEAVRHLNRAVGLVHDVQDRIELARLNAKFAQRSRAAAATTMVVACLEQAWSLLPEDHWQRLPDLSFELALLRAESKFSSGQHAQAEGLLTELSARDLGLERSGAVVCLQLAVYAATSRFPQAIDAGLQYLRAAGVPWQEIDADELRRQYGRLKHALGPREVESLAGGPSMSSPAVRTIMEVCAGLQGPAFNTNQQLLALLTMHMATLSIEHGHCDISVNAYGFLTVLLGPLFGEYELGFEFGKLGSRLAEDGANRFAARAWMFMGAIVAPRTLGARTGPPWLARAAEAADQLGDVVYGVYTRVLLATSVLHAGVPLDEAERQTEAATAFADRHGFIPFADRMRMFQASIHALREPGFSGHDFYVDDYAQAVKDHAEGYYYCVKRLQVRYNAGDFADARAAGRRAQELAWTAVNFPEEIELWVFGALAEAACANPGDPTEALERMAGYERELVAWSERGPATFSNKAALIIAERERLTHHDEEAERNFERAASLARQHGLLHEEALAHELAARFYEARGITSVARAKLALARSCYLRWGALAKVAQLDAQCGSFEDLAPAVPLADSLDQLDVQVLVSALQAVSSALELDKLVDALMKSALQQAAAEHGLLVLVDHEPRIFARAAARDGAIQVTPEDLASSPENVPESILHYALRSGERVSTRDGVVPAPFRGDPYFAKQTVRSLLCLPIVLRGKAVGALYLENSLARQSYGARKLAMLDLIASQAAISLENARLYAGIHEAQQQMARAERISRTGSFSWRPEARKSNWSDEVSDIYGIDGPPSIVALRERTHPEDHALFDSMVGEPARYDGQPVELRLLMRGGAVKYVVVIASRVGPDEYVGTIRDVTESKHAEDALERTQAKLADMARAASLAELSAAIAHEVTQPVTAIGVNAGTCLRRLSDENLDLPGARVALDRIARDAGRATAVVKRLRALFSKTQGTRAAVDLNGAITEVVTLTRNRVRSAGAKLTLELSPDLPRALGDRVQLQQVVMNLLNNAVDAVAKEPLPRAVTIRTSLADRGLLCCEVLDSGPGVSEADRGRIFEPFYTTKAHGMGIGLSICSNIMASHGGELSFRAIRAGAASTFYFTLPSALSA